MYMITKWNRDNDSAVEYVNCIEAQLSDRNLAVHNIQEYRFAYTMPQPVVT